MLFGVQLGGGTDIGGALGYCRRLVTRPRDTVLMLVSDLFEGGNADALRARVAELVRDGVHRARAAGAVRRRRAGPRPPRGRGAAALGATVMACTPDEFPELLAAALSGGRALTWPVG